MVNHNRGRIPRNKKKAWRKQVDISEVENYLDDVRLQHRFGGLLEHKDDQLLFSVEKQPAAATSSSGGSGTSPTDPGIETSGGGRRHQALDTNQLRCFAALKGLPGAAVPCGTNSVTTRPPEFVSAIRAAKCLRQDRRKLAAAAAAAAANSVTRGAAAGAASIDLWSDDPVAPKSEAEAAAGDWMAESVRNCSWYRTLYPARRPSHMRIPASMTPAVELPHPGQSYHPERRAHDQLVARALHCELSRLADESKWRRQTTDKFPSAKPTQEEYLAEMSACLPGFETVDSDNDEDGTAAAAAAAAIAAGGGDDGNDQSAGGGVAVAAGLAAARRVAKPKSRQQRRRGQIHREKERRRLQAIALRRSQAQVFRVRSLRRELDAEQQRLQLRREQRAARLAQLAAGRRLTLSRCRQPPPEVAAAPQLTLTDQLPGALRKLASHEPPMLERYQSLLRRNVLEARNVVRRKRKYKLKRYDRITCSDREPNKIQTERTL